jgi:predicted dehydrogenase
VGVVESGVRHFIGALSGDVEPVLTAEHARHVLDIIVQAYASIEDGRAHEVQTSI